MRKTALVVLLCLPGGTALAAPGPRTAIPERGRYVGTERLSDADLRLFLAYWGAGLPEGSRIPQWAPRWVERLRGSWGPPAARQAGPDEEDATVGPNRNLSRAPDEAEAESFIAIDRSDPLRLVGGSNAMDRDAQIMYWSKDGGVTWNDVDMPLGKAAFHSDPGVTWDSKGVAYACALGVGASVEVQVVRSLDGGATWLNPEVVYTADGSDKELMVANHQRGTSCADTVCVAWNEVGSPGKLRVGCAVGGLGPWSVTVPATGDFIGACPAFGPQGELLVAYTNIGQRRIDIVRSADCGQTWTTPARVATWRGDLNLGIPAMCDRTAFVYPALDVDRSTGPRRGSLYVVWTDSDPAATCRNWVCARTCSTNVYFARSTDGGLTWSQPVTVHTDVPQSDQFNPWLAVDDTDGSVHVMWYDTRHDPNRNETHVLYRSSGDGGQTWSCETRVTSAPSDESRTAGFQYGDYNGLAVHAGRAYPIWADYRTSLAEQAHTAEVTSGGGAPPDLGNSLRAVKTPAPDFHPQLGWTDLNAGEIDYKAYRGTDRDPNRTAPSLLGRSGGPDAVTYTDSTAPTTDGTWYYKVRGLGPCNEELSTW